MADRREERYLLAHDAVFNTGRRSRIPHQILRDYLDWQREEAQAKSERAALAMREVTVTGQWVEHLPQPMRRDMVKDIFSLAAQFGWTVRVGGQRWEGENRT